MELASVSREWDRCFSFSDVVCESRGGHRQTVRNGQPLKTVTHPVDTPLTLTTCCEKLESAGRWWWCGASSVWKDETTLNSCLSQQFKWHYTGTMTITEAKVNSGSTPAAAHNARISGLPHAVGIIITCSENVPKKMFQKKLFHKKIGLRKCYNQKFFPAFSVKTGNEHLNIFQRIQKIRKLI